MKLEWKRTAYLTRYRKKENESHIPLSIISHRISRSPKLGCGNNILNKKMCLLHAQILGYHFNTYLSSNKIKCAFVPSCIMPSYNTFYKRMKVRLEANLRVQFFHEIEVHFLRCPTKPNNIIQYLRYFKALQKGRY